MTKSPLRLPRTLVYTTIRCTLVGALACSSHGETRPDASSPETYDSSDACAGPDPALFCGPLGPCSGSSCPCPENGAYYCSSQCPPGCELLVIT
jgi:hypothetical protein